MYLVIAAGPTRVQLEDAENLRDLHVRSVASDEEIREVLHRNDLGVLVDDHVYLFPSALAGLVGSNDPDWRSRFDAMIKYAVASGWSDAEGRVRAHIVRGSVT
jgi:hypothetical protein